MDVDFNASIPLDVNSEPLVGRTGLLTVHENSGDIQVKVVVKKVVRQYGVLRLWIKPVKGKGQVLVNASRIAWDEDREQ